ncbi:MAG: pyridoxal phosphate-dependent aminotransferase [Alphaproteobacteria bacterium]
MGGSRPGRLMRPAVTMLRDSLIRRIAEEGMGLDDVIPLWFGEGDDPTPDFIRDAAVASLRAGQTQYTANRGIEPLREQLAGYMSNLHGRPIDVSQITVTASGMAAIMVAMELLLEKGDNMVVVTPVWPNCIETAHIMGAATRLAPLVLEDGGWRLDLDGLVALIDEDTRAVFVNSPGNPTGWVMDREQQQALLDVCRRRGVTIVADEVYERLSYESDRAPSFLDIADVEDRLIVVNSFSKSWSMTGWRLGWMTHAPALGSALAMLQEYNIAAPTTFVQHAGITALRDGEPYVADIVGRYRRNRDIVYDRMATWPRIKMARPSAAFYGFFAVDGVSDSYALARELLHERKVGLAPGAAFGPAGEGYMRLCFASTPETLNKALDRLEPALG